MEIEPDDITTTDDVIVKIGEELWGIPPDYQVRDRGELICSLPPPVLGFRSLEGDSCSFIHIIFAPS